MKKLGDLKKVFSNLELEGQGRGIIMGVTRLLLLGPFYYIQTNFLYFFAHDCNSSKLDSIKPVFERKTYFKLRFRNDVLSFSVLREVVHSKIES